MKLTRKQLMEMKIDRPSDEIAEQVKAIWDGIAKPLDGLGEFEAMVAKIGAIQGTTVLSLEHRGILNFCADNGIVAEGVSQSGQEVTGIVAGFMGRQESSVGKMAVRAGVRDCKVMHGTRDFLVEPAMTEEEALQAVSVGITLVEECKNAGFGILGTGEMGIGNTTTSSAVAAALLGLKASEVTGRGAGLDNEGLLHKKEVIEEALSNYPVSRMDGLEILRTFGGLDIAGMAGVCIGGALYHVPVVLDGLISSVAALAAEKMVPGVKEYLLASHLSKEPAAKEVARQLGLHPVIDAGLGLGEGTGAVMLFSLLDLAMALYTQQTTFENMEIAQYERFFDKEVE